MKDRKYELAKSFGRHTLDDLPINYRLMEPVSGELYISIAESKFHQTKAYQCCDYYKPISRIISLSVILNDK